MAQVITTDNIVNCDIYVLLNEYRCGFKELSWNIDYNPFEDQLLLRLSGTYHLTLIVDSLKLKAPDRFKYYERLGLIISKWSDPIC